MENMEQLVSPLVSVVMPAYKAERFIGDAIQSVINQTVEDWELIIVEDCSPDETYREAELLARTDSRITLLRNEKNQGVSRTRNRGIDLCRGEYIAFLDSDDIWHPEKLERQLQRMRAMNADIGYCSYALIGAAGDKVRGDYLVPETVEYSRLLKENVIQCSAMLIRSDIVKKYKFNTDFYHEDYILGLQILRDGGVAAGCREVLLDWRYIENSRSFDKKRSAGNRWKIYREYLGLSLGKSAWLFANYAVAGFRKYFRKIQQNGAKTHG